MLRRLSCSALRAAAQKLIADAENLRTEFERLGKQERKLKQKYAARLQIIGERSAHAEAKSEASRESTI